VWPLVDALYLDIPKPSDGRKPKKIPFNEANFKKREFQELWGRINHKAVYQVEFDSDELIKNCVRTLDTSLNVTVMQYLVEAGKQVVGLEVEQLEAGTGFKVSETKVEHSAVSAGSRVKYDLLGEIAEKTQLTRRTCAAILTGINPGTFAKFKQNPEQFITEAARLINEQKATVIVEHLTYDPLDNRYDSSIFTENQTAQDLSKAGDKLKKSVYEYVVTDSKVERSSLRSSTSATRSSSTRSCRAGSSSRPRSATTTPTGPSPSATTPRRSSTSTSSPRPRARCPLSNSRASRTPRSSAPASSSPPFVKDYDALLQLVTV
jgi:type III restriction enzyme